VKLTQLFVASDTRGLDQVTDALLDHLAGNENGKLFDADVSAALASGLVEVSVVATGSDFDEAVSHASDAIDRAVRAAGAAASFDELSRQAELIVLA
jgi:hypothetical protein